MTSSTKSSEETTLSTEYLSNTLERLKWNKHRDSTREMYHSAWCSFNNFFVKLDVKPNRWADRLALFITYLIDKKKPKATIKSYASGIKAVLKEDGVVLSSDEFELASILKASNYSDSQAFMRLPIQIGMLRLIIDKLDDYFNKFRNQPYLATLYKAVTLTGYYGLFRVGELTKSTHTIKFENVFRSKSKKKFLIVLRSRKTHWTNDSPQVMKINATGLQKSRCIEPAKRLSLQNLKQLH